MSHSAQSLGKSKVLALLVALLLAAASYKVFVVDKSPEMVTGDNNQAINSYLMGEIASLDVLIPPEPMPNHVMMRAGGSPLSISDLKGKAVLLNLWASWCAPCQAEMKELLALQQALGSETFEVVALNVDRGGVPAAIDALDEWGIAYGDDGLAIYTDKSMKSAFDIAGGKLPTSLIINREGLVIAKYIGPLKWDEPEALVLFQALSEGLL